MKKFELKNFLIIQFAVVLYSLVSVFSKVASTELSSYGISLKFLLVVFSMLMILAIYAFFWQMILKKSNLSLAYLNKATVLFWTSIWSLIFFKESISINNILGVIIIFSGIIMVTKK